MSKTFISKQRAVPLIVLAGFVILSLAIGSWFRLIYSSPTAVFDRMLRTTFSTRGLTKNSYQKQEGQELYQTAQLITSPYHRVHSRSVLKQGSGGGTAISTESIGTVSADYVRYTKIETDQKTAEGKEFDFKSVVGVWGKADANDPYSGGAQLYDQTALGVVPIGNLASGPRTKLIRQIKEANVFDTDFNSVKRVLVNGRPRYTYDVAIKPVVYITMLKSFAKEVGIKNLEQVDPAQYEGSSPIKFSFDIDVWSGQLLGIKYKDSERTENYGGYGARIEIKPPEANISAAELQQRLQQTQ